MTLSKGQTEACQSFLYLQGVISQARIDTRIVLIACYASDLIIDSFPATHPNFSNQVNNENNVIR